MGKIWINVIGTFSKNFKVFLTGREALSQKTSNKYSSRKKLIIL